MYKQWNPDNLNLQREFKMVLSLLPGVPVVHCTESWKQRTGNNNSNNKIIKVINGVCNALSTQVPQDWLIVCDVMS